MGYAYQSTAPEYGRCYFLLPDFLNEGLWWLWKTQQDKKMIFLDFSEIKSHQYFTNDK